MVKFRNSKLEIRNNIEIQRPNSRNETFWGAIRSASRLSCCFGQRQTNSHTAPLECGDLSPLWPGCQNESGDKSPHSISHLLFVRLLRASCGNLTRTSNCTRSSDSDSGFGFWALIIGICFEFRISNFGLEAYATKLSLLEV